MGLFPSSNTTGVSLTLYPYLPNTFLNSSGLILSPPGVVGICNKNVPSTKNASSLGSSLGITTVVMWYSLAHSDIDHKIALSYSIDSNAVMQPEKFVVRDI